MKQVLTAFLFLPVAAFAQTLTLPTMPDEPFSLAPVRPSQTLKVERAKIRILSFSNNRLTDLDITVGNPLKFRELEIELKGCSQNKEKNQDLAWLDIRELPDIPLFSGWMFNNFPDASTLDHPKYDARLIGCLPSEEIPQAQAVPVLPADVEMKINIE